ncbi:branched-chain-amino-acid aminotransferase [Anaeramoeba flamelloides]|uniref:branched-chain-amino-acid transaminase n=1 Tax=Anaeramoeba flamelloides TaxID=1746091 RepID=A0AAV7YR10_9EUKA|nr:branched-chain-amino-acid aminotransferase [Anaeramoeba flamelloides]
MNKKLLGLGLAFGAGIGAGLLVNKCCKKTEYPMYVEGTEKDINSSKIEIIRAKKLKKKKADPKDYQFGKTYTDHILEIDYDEETKFSVPRIVPFHNFSMHPATSVLHYGITAFEGMKAYKDKDENIRFFRPMKNMNRFLESGRRLALPDFDPEELLKCIEMLVWLERDWIPNIKGYSCYLRPVILGTDPFIGIKPSHKFKICVFMCPVGPYYSDGFTGIQLHAQKKYLRAWEGGTGGNKLGGNYAPTLLPIKIGVKMDCKSVLFLDHENKITEAGAMNCMILWINENSEKELITPSLDDNTILPGITRESILTLAREWGECKVTEGSITIKELIKAFNEKRLLEMFGCGTAAIISPITSFIYKDKTYEISNKKDVGKFGIKLFNTILDIQHGYIEHEWSHKIEEKDF